MNSFVHQQRNTFYILLISIFTTFIIQLNLQQAPVFQPENQVAFHLLLEFFSIFVCFTICSYGWKAFTDTKSSTYLWILSIFFVVGFLDIMHTLNYQGMPIFISEPSNSKSAWFGTIARITTSIAMVLFLLIKEKTVYLRTRQIVFIPIISLTTLVTVSIYYLEPYLPALVVETSGTTPLKSQIGSIISILLFCSIYLSFRRYRLSRDSSELHLFLAFSLLFISEIMLMSYQHIFDLSIVIAHIYKAIGYIFMMKAFYFSKIQLSFQHKNEAETNRKNTEYLLDSFFQHTPDSITILDLNGRIVRTNPGFEVLYGWKEAEVTGKHFTQFIPNVDDGPGSIFFRVKNGEKMTGYETIHCRIDGTRLFISMTISPILNDSGKIIYIAAITRDITKQKESEHKIREKEQELTETVQKQQGVIFKYKKVEDKFIHTLCGGELLDGLPFTSEDVVGKEVFDHLPYNEAYYTIGFYEKAWSGEDTAFELKLFDRTYFITLKPLCKNAVVTEVIGFGMDVSQLKETEELLQKSEKLAVVGELAAGFAHEIRNPLTTLKGFTQLINTQKGSIDDFYVDIMLSELDRIEMITNEFMVVAKPQSTKYALHNAIELLHDVIIFSNPQAQLCNIQVDVNDPGLDLLIYCDKNQIKQVLINLIKNAIESMPTGGHLNIEVNTTYSHLTITITDTGCGIPTEIIPRLGEPFYTLKEKGTGLGLMVSFRIIEAHNGSITFHSEENIGTVVHVKLPRVSLPDSEKCQ